MLVSEQIYLDHCFEFGCTGQRDVAAEKYSGGCILFWTERQVDAVICTDSKSSQVFKSVKGLAPDYMCELFESVQMVSSRNTRSTARDDLYVPRARTQLFQSTLYLVQTYGTN